MTTPTSFDQMVKAYEQLGKPGSEPMQWLLASGILGDIGHAIAAGIHLSDVDREALRALLVPPSKPIPWGTAADYAAKLYDWVERFRLGLSPHQIDGLFAELPDHAGPLLPTGITCTLGKGLQHDWKVVMRVIKYELQKRDVKFTEYFDASRLSYFPGSEPVKTKTPQLGVALLDLETFWDPQNGVMPREARRQRSRWPGLEVAWLLALNPQVAIMMDGKAVPYMFAPGLVVGRGSLPVFSRDDREVYVNGVWDGSPWYRASVVSFRE